MPCDVMIEEVHGWVDAALSHHLVLGRGPVDHDSESYAFEEISPSKTPYHKKSMQKLAVEASVPFGEFGSFLNFQTFSRSFVLCIQKVARHTINVLKRDYSNHLNI
jgi:hypothetical protein